MSNRYAVLSALATHGPSTYDDLLAGCELDHTQIRWTCVVLEIIKAVTRARDAVTSEIVWHITEHGRQRLAGMIKTKDTPAGGGDVSPAVAHLEPRVAGGPQQTDPPSEGAATVIEAARRDKMPAAPASDQPGGRP
jgi:hypothetical protein